MPKYNKDSLFSLFIVYDYHGGKLTPSINISLNELIKKLFNNGVIKNDAFECYDQIFDFSNEDISKFCNSAILQEKTHAGDYNQDALIRIYEHVDNKLVKVELSEFRNDICKFIINLKEQRT